MRRPPPTITAIAIRRGRCPGRDLIELRATGGLTGWGEGFWGERALHRAPDHLFGRSPFEAEAIFDELSAGGEPPGGLDTAVWDLAAQALGRPVCHALGKVYRNAVLACEFPLPGYLCDPLPPDDLEGYRRLKAEGKLPVAMSRPLAPEVLLRDFVAGGSADLVIGDLALCGLTGLRRLSYFGCVFRVRLGMNCSGSPVSIAAALHAGACIPPPAGAPAAAEPLVISGNGIHRRLTVPDDPGLGVDIEPERPPDFVLGKWNV